MDYDSLRLLWEYGALLPSGRVPGRGKEIELPRRFSMIESLRSKLDRDLLALKVAKAFKGLQE